MPSFNIDATGLLTMAAQIFNTLGPIFFLVAGISVGIGLLMRVVEEVRRAL